MDVQVIAKQVIDYLGSDPKRISQFVEHPYSTTATATGSEERVSKDDMSQIVTQVAAQATDQNLGKGDTANIASMLMGQSGGSVHSLASSLFGAATAGDGNLGGMVNLGGIVSSLLGGGGTGGSSMAEIAAKSAVGGIAARGMASLLTSAMGATGNATQDDGAGQAPDFSTLAKLAGGLLGK